MSGGIRGRIGPYELEWLTRPQGKEGVAKVRVHRDGKVFKDSVELRWRKESRSIWIEFADQVRGFDFTTDPHDDLGHVFEVSERTSHRRWMGLSFERGGAGALAAGGSSGKKKGIKIKSQMPGKIVRLLVQPQGQVEKGQPLLVMEAMKMENEIRAPITGRVSKITVTEGQAVETGAELIVMDSAENKESGA